MNEYLQPSEVLEQYDVVGRSLPARLVGNMRDKFRTMENDGENTWRVLVNEVASLSLNGDKPKKVDLDRLWVAQACAEVLTTKINTKITIDGFSWKKRVKEMKSKEDFESFFLLIGIPGTNWGNSDWFIHNGYSQLRAAISEDERFNGWANFLEFMEFEHDTIRARVASCDTPQDFLVFFEEREIPESVWSNSLEFGRAEYSRVYRAILEDDRFGSIDKYRKFMGVVDNTWKGKVERCKTPADFIALFRAAGIEGDEWKNSKWLKNNGYKRIYMVTRDDERFGSWNAFKIFMDAEVLRIDRVDQLKDCNTPEDFIRLFVGMGYSDNEWINTPTLARDGHGSLVRAILNKLELDAWSEFLEFMDSDSLRENEDLERLSELKLEDAVALLGKDPLKLKYYLQMAHPELLEEEVDRLVRSSFKGFYSRSAETKEGEYLDYTNELPRINFTESPEAETEEETVTISGKCKGADAMYISGDWNRRVRVEADGSFSVTIPLKIGERNEIRVMGINRDQELRSPQRRFVIWQEGEPDDVGALIEMLNHLRTDVVEQIRKDPGRFNFFVQCTEQVLIKKFVTSFEQGEAYTMDLIETCDSSLVRRVLRRVLKNFRATNRKKYKHFREDAQLYFFQKHCEELMTGKIEAGEDGMILANDPGLGKTRNVLGVIEDYPAVVITPNSVCSTWGEEAALCLREPDLLMLNNMPHKQRKELLRRNGRRHVVTNQEFLRNPDDKERFDLLSQGNPIIVHDEAHSRANLNSQQTRGAQMLEGRFLLMMTATFARSSQQFCRMMHNITPEDPRFKSWRAFCKAFPPEDPEAMRALSILKQQYVVRFRKQDVMEEFDPNVPLDEQQNRLPRKHYIPSGKYGRFEVGEEQAQAIYEMFLYWGEWSKKYDKYVPKDEVAQMDHLRQGNSLTKLHALRQTVNNPDYVNSDEENAKLQEMKRTVRKCKREGRKVLIFCRYNAQANKYAEEFADMNPALYTGVTSEQGVKRDDKGKPILYKQNPGGDWVIGGDGLPVEDEKGVPMLALDYERLRFQNTDDCGLVIATYAAGAVGVTFTAAKAVIEDDAPADYIERYQAEDRAHRIDNRFKTHYDVKYYRMQSEYPEEFLERMKTVWVHKQEDGSYKEVRSAARARRLELPTAYEEFFEQGTYDEVHADNLEVQRRMFHLINDGIADESILEEDQISFKGF